MFAIEHESSIELIQQMKHSSWYQFLSDNQLGNLRQLQTGHRLHIETVRGYDLHIMRLPNRVALYRESTAFESMTKVLAALGCLAHGDKFRRGAPLTRELIDI